MNDTILKYYRQFRVHSPFMLVGHNAELALRSARTLARFRELEAQDLVRMRAEPEQDNYFDVFGVPDDESERKRMEGILETLGCWWTVSEYRDYDGRWEHADSCGMHTGYNDPLDPFENCYVIDEMGAAVERAEHVLAEPAEAHDAACRDIATVS